MLTPQEMTKATEKLSSMIIEARELGGKMDSIFSELDRTADQLKDGGIEMNIAFNDKPTLQAAWHSYKNATNEPALPHILRAASG